MELAALLGKLKTELPVSKRSCQLQNGASIWSFLNTEAPILAASCKSELLGGIGFHACIPGTSLHMSRLPIRPRFAKEPHLPGLLQSRPASLPNLRPTAPGSWDLIGPPPAGLSFTPTSHPEDSVSTIQLVSPLRPPKARARAPVQASHHISQLLRPRNAWPARDELPPRSGPIHGAPCCTTGGLPPPSYGKSFRTDLPSARPKPAPAPGPPPRSASLNKPSPAPAHALHCFRSQHLQPRLQQGLRLLTLARLADFRMPPLLFKSGAMPASAI